MKLNDLQNEHISHILALWHAWSKASSRVGAGYARVSPGFESHRTSRQYDDANGALADAADMQMARAVDAIISRIDEPHRTALHIEAKNIDAPGRVWANARIDLIGLEKITEEARGIMWARLEAENLV